MVAIRRAGRALSVSAWCMLALIAGCGSDDDAPLADASIESGSKPTDASQVDVAVAVEAAADAGRGDSGRDAGRDASSDGGVAASLDASDARAEAEAALMSTCGNGTVEGSERCDNGAANDMCTTGGDGGVRCNACSTACTDNTACHACMAVECPDQIDVCAGVGDNTEAGREKIARCHAVYACVIRTGCAANASSRNEAPDIMPCYCGTLPISSASGGEGPCYDNNRTTGQSAANGPCKTEIETAHESTDPGTIILGITDITVPGGAAMYKVQCEVQACADSCFFGRVVPPRSTDGGAESSVPEANVAEAAAPVEAQAPLDTGIVPPDTGSVTVDAAGTPDATGPVSSLPVNAACQACLASAPGCSVRVGACETFAPDKRSQCLALLDCGRRTMCHAGSAGIIPCYCGSLAGAACTDAVASSLDGACKVEFERAGIASYNDAFINLTPAAAAMSILECDRNPCAQQCIPYDVRP